MTISGYLRGWITLSFLEDVKGELGYEEWDWRCTQNTAAAELPGRRAGSLAIA